MTALLSRTSNYNLAKIIFDAIDWGDLMNDNMDRIDATLTAVAGAANIQGTWSNSLAVTVGQRYIDPVSFAVYEVLIAHTTASSGTFEADRTANPTYWESYAYAPRNRGAWTTATTYSLNEIVTSGAIVGICLKNFTSGASYAADVSANNIQTLFSGTATAASTTFTPAGDIAATDVQVAIEELDTEKTSVAKLASTSTSEGASLVGIEDAGGLLAAADVEAALAEIAAEVDSNTSGVSTNASGIAANVTAIAGKADASHNHDATYTKIADLASTANAKGASLAGVEDVAGNFTGTDVEAVLAELATSSGGVPRGYLSGLGLANNGTDADHDVDFSAGTCRSADDDANIVCAALTKQLDASYVTGTNNGGLSSSLSIAADTWYHCFAIIDSADNHDFAFDTSVSAANLVTDHSIKDYRRIGSILTDASSNVKAFSQQGNLFFWNTPQQDINTSTLSTTAVLYTISTPPVDGITAYTIGSSSHASSSRIIITNPVQADVAPATYEGQWHGASSYYPRLGVTCHPDASSQIRARASASSTTLVMNTVAWVDQRGQN